MGKRKQVRILKTGKAYLFPVENLSTVFQAKFISALNKRSLQERSFNLELKKTNWAVYAKEPFGGPEQVEEYLGRYMRKTAISNHRLLSIDENGVRFKYHNYRDSRQKQMLHQLIAQLAPAPVAHHDRWIVSQRQRTGPVGKIGRGVFQFFSHFSFPVTLLCKYVL